MYRIFFISIAALFLSGCGSSMSLNLTPNSNDSANFKAGECQAVLPLKYIGSSYQNGRISIQRSFYQNGGDVLVYERGSLNDNFRFIVSIDSLIGFAFEFKRVKTTSIGDFYTYFEGINREGKNIYVIAGGMGAFENFDLLYSDKEEIIKKLALCVRGAEFVEIAIKNPMPIFNPSSYIRSDFFHMLFFKYDIVSSKRGDRYIVGR